MQAEMRTTDRRAERAAERRDQILAAARACFRAEGFHGASMNRIAAEAGMSVGHIYQYFANKEAIIIALCERDFEEFIARMPDPSSPEFAEQDSARNVSCENIAWLLNRDRAAIALEVMSEASRNPTITDVVRKADEGLRARMLLRAKRLMQGFSEQEVEARVDAMMLMLSGLSVRAAVDPNVDPARMQNAIATIVAALVPLEKD